MKQQYIYICEEIQTGKAMRTSGSYKGTKLYTIKGACQNQVDWRNRSAGSTPEEPKYELVTYELKRV
jgi:hypothetical protein